MACVIPVLAACGGAPARHAARPSLGSVVSRGNAVCAATAQKVANIAPPPFAPRRARARDLPVAASYLDRVVPLLQDERAQIRALGTPSSSKQLHLSVMRALDALVDDEDAARAAAHARQVPAFKSAVARQLSDARHLSGLAAQFGLTTCAQE